MTPSTKSKPQGPSSAPVAPPPAAAERAPLTPRQRLWENFKGIVIPIVIFLFVRAFVIEAYRIPTGSMEPTLLVGDWLFVNKFIYGPHVPFTHWNFPGVREPRHGDVVVFISPPQPDEAAQGRELQPILVKRLIGEPGDTLYMRAGVLYRNGVAQKEPYLNKDYVTGDSMDELFEWQRKVALKSSRFGPAPDQPTHDNWGPLVVPPAHLFMMGDNRYNSKDARYWGFVPRENVRGEPLFVYYSYDAQDSDVALPFLTAIRWRRIGHWIR